MKQAKLRQLIIKVLKKDDRLWDEDKTELNQTLLLDLVEKIDEKIIDLLLQEKDLREKFFVRVRDVYVFKTNDFCFFMEENKVDNSYTAYKNRIGLTDGKKFLKDTDDVVLDFPYKDCVLEGGQSTEEGTDSFFEYEEEKTKTINGEKVTEEAGYKEKQGRRKEIFFNSVLAHDEIDRLFDAKALTNWKRFTKDGEQEVKEIKRDEDLPAGKASGTIKENMIIKGNNLLALHSLKKQFSGKVKLIYIDPPYYFKDKKADDAFAYNSNFKLSTWLTFMKNRLEVARDLLADNGTIFIQIEDDGQAYLQLLLNDIFKNNYLNTVIVKAKASSGASGGGEDKKLKKNTEYIHIYYKNSFVSFKDIYTEEKLDNYIDNLREEEKSFAYKSVLVNFGKSEYITSTKDGRGEEIKIYKHKNYEIKSISQISKEEKIEEYEVYKKYIDLIFTTENAQTSIRDRVLKAVGDDDCLYTAEYVPVSGKNKGNLTKVMFIGNTKRLVSFLKNTCEIKNKEIYKQLKIGTLWDDMSWSSVFSEGNVRLKGGKKPEKLLQRILEMATEKNDIVLDYHLGSGTTCAVAHKMERQYIGIEQLDYEEKDSVVRLQNVINGDQSGISKSVNWKGGGDFIYFELAKWNETAKEKIQEAKSLEELEQFFDEMYERYFLNYNFKIKEFKEKVIKEENFRILSLEEQKKIFIAMLDNNQMYVNKTEMADAKYNISKKDQRLTKVFYNSQK